MDKLKRLQSRMTLAAAIFFATAYIVISVTTITGAAETGGQAPAPTEAPAKITTAAFEGTPEELEALPLAVKQPMKAAPATEPEPEEETEPSRYAGIELTEDDIETLARLVWLEARGEPYEGQVAVVEVVFNRILSDRFTGQDTVSEVVFAPGQFSPAGRIWDSGTSPTQEQYDAVADAYAAAEPVTELDVVYFSCGPQNDRIYAVIGNHYFCHV